VMMPETDIDSALTFAEKLRSLVESTPVASQAGPLRVTVSIGVATIPHPNVHAAKELIVTADGALYRAKHAGRNQVKTEETENVAASG
jgi:diguanylate cyclase (GGDEF)-like protein